MLIYCTMNAEDIKLTLKVDSNGVNLCFCNNCNSILIDNNPQIGATLYKVVEEINAKEMTELQDEDGFFWVCPTCIVDDYLTDL